MNCAQSAALGCFRNALKCSTLLFSFGSQVGLEPTTLRLRANHQPWSTHVINGVQRSTQEDSESLWRAIRRRIRRRIALELRIRPLAFGSTAPTASGNLVVDRTDTGFAQPSAPGGNASVQHPSDPPCAGRLALAATLPAPIRQFAVTSLAGSELWADFGPAESVVVEVAGSGYSQFKGRARALRKRSSPFTFSRRWPTSRYK
jgi:hypothetical protein